MDTENTGQDRPTTAAATQAVFLAEPGACAGRLNPDQQLVPLWLAPMIDFHLWPSIPTPGNQTGRARTLCEHIDWELISLEHPEFFARRAQVGFPGLSALWEAKTELAETGVSLAYDVQLEDIDGHLALAIYGAGVIGRLDDEQWNAVAGLLTTCASTIHEPRADVNLFGTVLRPARPPALAGKRPLPPGIRPATWEIGDWMHTWWGYPVHGVLRPGCPCAAHTAAATAPQFGPGTRVTA